MSFQGKRRGNSSYRGGRRGNSSYRGGRRGNSSYRDEPVEKGREYEADIVEISRRGDGIAKIGGFVIFVPNTRVGEHVTFKVNQVSRKYATAKAI